jgi:ABC-2 type transport system ATP-binding protein
MFVHPKEVFMTPFMRAPVPGEARLDGYAIETRDLVKTYPGPRGPGTLRAVDGLSLQIPKGGFYGLLGPNGAGKTTTIRILTGLSRRTSGEARVGGMDVRDDFRATRRLVGLAPQEFDFDQFLTTQQVLFYHGLYFEMKRRHAKRNAEELLERFQLAHKRDVRVIHLSGGQKRRLLIAKALMHEPEVLVLDEPTAGIDVSLRRDLWDYLREQNRMGRTILLTTHYIEEAEALCDRVGIIDQGRLVAEGAPDELSQKSGSDRVCITLSKPLEQVPGEVTKGLGLDVSLEEDGGLLVAQGGRGGRVATQLLERLVASGIRVESLEIRRQSLEDAFVQLTGLKVDKSGAISDRNTKQGGNV